MSKGEGQGMLGLLGLFNAALLRAVQIVVDVLLTPRQRRLQERARDV